jgi:hypothetical protein
MFRNCLNSVAKQFNTGRMKMDTSRLQCGQDYKPLPPLTMKGRTPTPDRPHRHSMLRIHSSIMISVSIVYPLFLGFSVEAILKGSSLGLVCPDELLS